MFTSKIITLSQDLYWNSKQNIPVTSKMHQAQACTYIKHRHVRTSSTGMYIHQNHT